MQGAERVVLWKAGMGDRNKEHAFVRDMPLDENGFINAWHGVSYEDFLKKTLPEYLDYEKGQNLPDGFVPETFLFLWVENEIVGQFRIRHRLCESLRTGGGHIGYFIKREFRGRGYATLGLRETLKLANAIVPEDEIYLRVNKDNPASLRVMMKNGGYIHHEDEDKIYVRIANVRRDEA